MADSLWLAFWGMWVALYILPQKTEGPASCGIWALLLLPPVLLGLWQASCSGMLTQELHSWCLVHFSRWNYREIICSGLSGSTCSQVSGSFQPWRGMTGAVFVFPGRLKGGHLWHKGTGHWAGRAHLWLLWYELGIRSQQNWPKQ